jgi:hypothetical protein
MLNYQGLADIKEMMMSPGVHTTISKIVLSIAQAWSRIERIQGITHWVNPEPSLARGRCNDYPVGE